jgi:hypothetical protein
MSNEKELRKWASKWKLWKVLHYGEAAGCNICSWAPRINCPDKILMMSLDETQIFEYTRRSNPSISGMCIEWVRNGNLK